MFDSIENAIEDIKSGQMIIVVDDENRENEGDLVVSAEHLTTEQMAFIIRHTGGVVCLSLSNKLADQVDLPPMVLKNTSKNQTSFTISIEAVKGVTTGISAEDRVATIKAATKDGAKPTDLSRPGHVFPLRAEDGGTLWRAGHTEASVDLCVLAGLKPAAVISELMCDNGKVQRLPDLNAFAKEHNLTIVSVADLIAYRHRHEKFIKLEAETVLQTKTGSWKMKIYRDLLHDTEQIALVKGDVVKGEPTLVRVHSECFTGDTLGSEHCDCGGQLNMAMRVIEAEGRGVILYMKQEGRGIGLVNKIRAYELQRTLGLDTVQANTRLGLPEDLREYGIGAQIICDLGIDCLRLMTNNPKKMSGIEGYGLKVVEQVPVEILPNGVNNRYLQTKKDKMGHLLKNV